MIKNVSLPRQLLIYQLIDWLTQRLLLMMQHRDANYINTIRLSVYLSPKTLRRTLFLMLYLLRERMYPIKPLSFRDVYI